jgi:hypothetical protein
MKRTTFSNVVPGVVEMSGEEAAVLALVALSCPPHVALN